MKPYNWNRTYFFMWLYVHIYLIIYCFYFVGMQRTIWISGISPLESRWDYFYLTRDVTRWTTWSLTCCQMCQTSFYWTVVVQSLSQAHIQTWFSFWSVMSKNIYSALWIWHTDWRMYFICPSHYWKRHQNQSQCVFMERKTICKFRPKAKMKIQFHITYFF